MGQISKNLFSNSNKLTDSLLLKICEEHHKMAKDNDGNLGYLWFMYDKGTKKGTFKPFIVIAEINLLNFMGYIDNTEKSRMIGLLKSIDNENLFMLLLAINTLRENRVEEFGSYSIDNLNYKNIDYKKDIINVEIFKEIQN